jgi:hypothetical protein
MACALLKVNADMVQGARLLLRRRHPMPKLRRVLSGALLVAAVLMPTSRAIAAQDGDPPALSPIPLAAQANQNLQLSITRCGPTGSNERMEFTFEDERRNAWYRATKKGLNLSGNKGLYVIGGLLPRWNLAAQMGSEGGTAPGNVVNAMAWTIPNYQIGASPYPPPKVRIAWVPTGGTCQP